MENRNTTPETTPLTFKPAIAASENSPNTFYLFREDGKEVEFYLEHNTVKSKHYKLTDAEREYIETNYLKQI